ncbi:hypothetical protein FGO68_gene16365 [Halteria grandinella]|uniref:Uncharacterized protein n=1 Tax=Halteria grandinella TaxID=5974 RepID=A0A8J8T9N4_HALGN|nr:hypothetical protein FGO68_gene16365 [Halteria grandinella]
MPTAVNTESEQGLPQTTISFLGQHPSQRGDLLGQGVRQQWPSCCLRIANLSPDHPLRDGGHPDSPTNEDLFVEVSLQSFCFVSLDCQICDFVVKFAAVATVNALSFASYPTLTVNSSNLSSPLQLPRSLPSIAGGSSHHAVQKQAVLTLFLNANHFSFLAGRVTLYQASCLPILIVPLQIIQPSQQASSHYYASLYPPSLALRDLVVTSSASIKTLV